MNKFLTFLGTDSNGFSDFSKALEQSGGNVGATRGASSFRNKWVELATNETTATRFQKAQHDYIQRKYHDVAVRKIKGSTGIDICDGTHSNGLQDTIWSTAVQYGAGGCHSIVKEAVRNLKGRGKTEPTDEELINEIHDIKINSIPTRFKSSPNLHGGLRKRFVAERKIALANNIAPVQVASLGSGSSQVV